MTTQSIFNTFIKRLISDEECAPEDSGAEHTKKVNWNKLESHANYWHRNVFFMSNPT
jgi:hypothetical protein